MVVFVVPWPYLLTTKLSCLQKYNFGHTILGGQSEVFKKTLFGNSIEATSGKIEITDVSATTMENMLFYVYHEDQGNLFKGIVIWVVVAQSVIQRSNCESFRQQALVQ
jgi:hypothetical protein